MAIRKRNNLSKESKRSHIAFKGSIELYGSSSLTLPEGVSLILPAGVTQVGDIYLRDSSSLTLPAGVTQVGDIELFGSSSLNLPEGVTHVLDIRLHDFTSLTLPEGVTKVGDIALYDRSFLTFPKGLTQVGGLYALSGGCSITFPDGYMLKNSGHGILEFSAKEMNRLLSEHQKKHQKHSRKNFGIKM